VYTSGDLDPAETAAMLPQATWAATHPRRTSLKRDAALPAAPPAIHPAGSDLSQPVHRLTTAMPYTSTTCQSRNDQERYLHSARIIRSWKIITSDRAVCTAGRHYALTTTAQSDGDGYRNKKIQYTRPSPSRHAGRAAATYQQPDDLALAWLFQSVIDLVGDTIIVTEGGVVEYSPACRWTFEMFAEAPAAFPPGERHWMRASDEQAPLPHECV
jgi:hypothetical protein